MYRSSYGGTTTSVTGSIRRRRQRICTFPNTIIPTTHIRDSGTSIIHNNTKCHYYDNSTDIRIQHNYIGTTKAQTSYSQQSPHQRFSIIQSTRFLHHYRFATIVIPQKNFHYDYYKVKVYTNCKFPFLQLHSQRQISSDTSKATKSKSKMNSDESTTVAATPSTPTSSKGTTGNNSIAKIDTTTDLTKEDEQEVR